MAMRRPVRQLEFRMRALLRASHLSPEGIEREYGFNSEQVIAFCTDTWTSVSRAELQIFSTLAEQFDVTFQERPIHPAWRALEASTRPAVLFLSVGPDRGTQTRDAEAEAAMTAPTGLSTERFKGMVTKRAVVRAMQSENCIFIGGPRYNLGTTYALEHLWKNGGDVPFRFIWPEPRKAGRSTGAARSGAATDAPGLICRVGNQDHHVPISPPDRDTEGFDLGVLVVCLDPPGAPSGVTSIILAGHSGFATKDMARDLAEGTVFVPEEPAKGSALDIPVIREIDDGRALGWLVCLLGALRAPPVYGFPQALSRPASGMPVAVFMGVSFGLLNPGGLP